MWLNHSRLGECPGIYTSPFIMLHPLLITLQFQKSRREAFTPQRKLSQRRFIYTPTTQMLFGEHRIWCSHTRWIHSDVYPVLSPKHRCLKLKKLNHLSSCLSHTGHLTVVCYTKRCQSWAWTGPLTTEDHETYHFPSYIHGRHQHINPARRPKPHEAEETRSLLVLIQALLQMPENPEVTHPRARSHAPCCGKQGRGRKNKLVNMNPSSNKCRLFLGRFS